MKFQTTALFVLEKERVCGMSERRRGSSSSSPNPMFFSLLSFHEKI
jgi:hypothetical protein